MYYFSTSNVLVLFPEGLTEGCAGLTLSATEKNKRTAGGGDVAGTSAVDGLCVCVYVCVCVCVSSIPLCYELNVYATN